LAIAVFVELPQCGGRIVNFLRINHAIMVGIQHSHDRRHRASTAPSRSSWTARTWLARRLITRVLGDEICGGTGDCQGRDEYSSVHFHELSLVDLRGPARIKRDRAVWELPRRFIFHGATLRE
jgi:hypothetical protein